MPQDDKVMRIADYQDTSQTPERETKEINRLKQFDGFDWDEVFKSSADIITSNPTNNKYDKRVGSGYMSEITREEINAFKDQTSAELRHQKELDEHRYNSLSDRLSNDIKSSFSELDFKQKDALKDIKHENDTYIKSIETKNKELISDLKEELRQERKSDRNTIIGWVLGGSAVVVPIVTFLIPYILKLLTN